MVVPAAGGGRYGAPRLVERKPAFGSPGDGVHQLMDLQGDGRLDLVRYAPPHAGYFVQTGTYGGAGTRTGFECHRTLRSVPNVDFSDPDLRFLDVTGDGRADLVITQGDLLICYRGLGADGFEEATRVPVPRDEQAGPRVVFSDPESSVFVADMTGDGLSDIVRVERSRICYWPNQGHGRFGARVTMSSPPLLEGGAGYDARRVRLADLDGSGPADLVYLHPDGVQVHVNQAGNGWSEGRVLRGLPLPHRLADLQVVDLLGRGTACLVWSSSGAGGPRLAYVDLFGRDDDEAAPPSAYKPHLLVRARNNMGAETRIRYTPSTKFYLEARGTPDAWVTRLHFPVQVVDRVEHEDFVSKVRLVQRFAYHHGYYDPDEREFNGFGYVEQWDEESYDAARGSGRYDDALTGGRVGWVPPVYTRSWFHTGANRARNALEAALLQRARPNPDGLARMPGSVLPLGLSTQEEKDACRALRGQVLRQ
ncbi:MAG: VCBS repeat-containing protein, partial [Myxococcales bacterium]|nr:VCBS repeat-containing protein [Myxococcales bacterium]